MQSLDTHSLKSAALPSWGGNTLKSNALRNISYNVFIMPQKNTISPARTSAYQILHQVLTQKKILDECLPILDTNALSDSDRSLAREIISGTCRHFYQTGYVLYRG